MEATAKLFKNGRSQAVRLPKAFGFKGDEVFVKRIGDAVILTPKEGNPWKALLDSLHEFSEDFMSEERVQPSAQEREHF